MSNLIYIIGHIGNVLDDNGNVVEKGVELIDVVEQMASIDDVDMPTFVINSPGGYVSVGREISALIQSIPNAKTVGKELVGSIATEIFLSVKFENRSLEHGTEFFIHNPFIPMTSGNAGQLQATADELKAIENEMIAFYSKSTGLNKEALSALMNAETTLSADQCKKLGICSEIIPKTIENHVAARKAVALFYKNQKIEKMSKSITEKVKAAIAVLRGEEPENETKAVMVSTDMGELNIEGDVIQVGAIATMNDGPAADGSYTLQDGSVIVIANGMVESYEPMPTAEAFKQLQSENEALKQEISNLKDDNLSLETASSELIKEVEAFKALRSKTGSYAPKVNPQAKFTPKKTENTILLPSERRKQYKTK